MTRESNKPIIGQEAICPDGLGRVAAIIDGRGNGAIPGRIKVDTYINNRSCEWAPHNVELINPRRPQ